MRSWVGKRYWLIGASEGLGRALAMQMSRAGAHVILSSRDGDRLESLVADLPGSAAAVPVDVTDLAAVNAVAKSIGRIDGMVYLAGAYWPMTAADWSAPQVETMASVNFLGALHAVGAILPHMQIRGEGHIVLTGSLSAYRGLPGAIGYGATKAALKSLAETMRADLKHSGICVQLVNPGFIKTRLTDKNDFRMPFIMEPDHAARLMFEHMNTNRFRRDFPWPFSAMFRIAQFIPDWLYFRLV